MATTLLVALPSLAASSSDEPGGAGLTSVCLSDTDWQTIAIAPGIDRVIDDANGHRFDGGRVREVEFGPDGQLLVAQGARVVAIGTPGSIEPRSAGWRATPRRLSLTPGGTLWAAEDGGAAVAYRNEGWQDRSADMRDAGASLAVLEDGTVWRVVRGDDDLHRVVRWQDGAWRDAGTERPGPLALRGAASYTFTKTPDGRVWMGVDRGQRRGGLAFLEDDTWTSVEDLETHGLTGVQELRVGPDGSLWVLGADLETQPGDAVLARYADGHWTTHPLPTNDPDDGSGSWIGWSPKAATPLLADAFDRVWASPPGSGLFVLEGAAVRRVDAPGLGLGAQDLAVDERGCLWVATRRGALYRIDPTLIDTEPGLAAIASLQHAIPPSATGVTR